MMNLQRMVTACFATMTIALLAPAESMDAPRVEVGLRGGLSVSTWEGCNALVAPQGGISLALRIAPVPLYLESGVYYADKGYRQDNYNYWWFDYDYSYDDYNRRYHERYTQHQHTLQIPLVVSYHHYFTPKFSLRPFIGGYVAPVIDNNGEDLFENNCDLGLKVGCGIGYGAFYAALSCDCSFSNWDNGWYYENNNAQGTAYLTIGVNFSSSSRKPRLTYDNSDYYIH